MSKPGPSSSTSPSFDRLTDEMTSLLGLRHFVGILNGAAHQCRLENLLTSVRFLIVGERTSPAPSAASDTLSRGAE